MYHFVLQPLLLKHAVSYLKKILYVMKSLHIFIKKNFQKSTLWIKITLYLHTFKQLYWKPTWVSFSKSKGRFSTLFCISSRYLSYRSFCSWSACLDKIKIIWGDIYLSINTQNANICMHQHMHYTHTSTLYTSWLILLT